MVLSCYSTDTVTFINKEGVELFQIDKDKTRSSTYDTVHFKITIVLLYHLDVGEMDAYL